VWDYPRPPGVERTHERVRVVFAGEVIADTVRAFKCMETSHPPSYYVPCEDVSSEYLTESTSVSFCEYKGSARYVDVRVGDWLVPDAGWYYPTPQAAYVEMANCIAFYPGKMDECTVDGEVVEAQQGDYYGGWITADVVGPFKGAAGTLGW
jgi:uncharacterized protein (DUF427 family)